GVRQRHRDIRIGLCLVLFYAQNIRRRSDVGHAAPAGATVSKTVCRSGSSARRSGRLGRHRKTPLNCSRGVRFWHKSCYTIPSPTCVFLRCASLLWAYGPDLALLSNALDGPLGTIRQGRPRVGGGVSWNKQPSGGRRCASLLRGAKSCKRDP